MTQQIPLFEAQNLGKVFSGGLFSKSKTVALKNFSLSIAADKASIITLAGESGSGKTTAANLLLGLLSPSQGSIHFRGQDIWKMSSKQFGDYRREVQAIFQDPYEVFNPFYRVDRVLRTVIRKFGLADNRVQAHAMMIEALETVGLRPDDVLGKYPHELSGGQRQRIMIARAFLPRPRLIVADEPVSMLDASLRGLVLEIMLRLKDEFGISFIYVTHDLSTAYQISDRIMILYRGITVENGPIDPVITAPRHPYTQLLTASVPIPDPNTRWGQAASLPPAQSRNLQAEGLACNFVDRCQYVMEICRQKAPATIPITENHFADCYLYDPNYLSVCTPDLKKEEI